ncbi:MAG: hypothetical protein LBG92_09420 [Prevotellaceae bacterium]|jgi:hypothetical protein|nr:hypothetical protein [Prevotellaceae bacterium]
MPANKLKIAILLIFGLSALYAGNAQTLFYSQSLHDLYNLLPETCRVGAATDTVVLCRNAVQNETVPVIFRCDKNRIFEHVGLRFLRDSVMANNVIVRLIEREMLTALLSNDVNHTVFVFGEKDFVIKLNNKHVEYNFFTEKRQLLNLLKSCNGITIKYDGKNYIVILLCDNRQKLSFEFKADSELITGMNKREREIQLAFQLKNHRASNDSVAKPSLSVSDLNFIQQLQDTVDIKTNSFVIPQINNNLVYIRADSVYSLAFDKSLIAESFSNALLVPVGNNYKINITHRMYSNVVKKYTINSRDFDDYFLRDYDRYFGIESLEKEKLEGTLILSDRNAASIHLAYVTVSLDDLINGGTIEMQLYSNIPQHNVKTLFGKIENKNKDKNKNKK